MPRLDAPNPPEPSPQPYEFTDLVNVIQQTRFGLFFGARNGLYKWEDDGIYQYKVFNVGGVDPGQVFTIQEIDTGLLIGASKGLLQWDAAKNRVTQISGDGIRAVRKIQQTDTGILIVANTPAFGSNDETLFRWDERKQELAQVLKTSQGVNYIEQTSSGLLIATNFGLYRLDEKQSNPMVPITRGLGLVHTLRNTKLGLLVGAERGLFRWDDNAQRFDKVPGDDPGWVESVQPTNISRPARIGPPGQIAGTPVNAGVSIIEQSDNEVWIGAGCPYRKPYPASEQPRIGRCSFPMIDFLRLLAYALTSLFRSRARLEAEILVLRHQLNVLRRKAPKRVAFSSIDRLVFAGLYRLAPGVLDALKILKPETVIRWHRAGFRAYWRRKSRARGGRPKTPLEIRQLIRDMSIANPLWGAPRIHGELLMLGIDVGQTTVAKYMVRPRRLPSQGWKTFLHNHTDGIASMDLFVVPTVSFRLLYGLLILQHRRRVLLWLGVTAHPTAEWIARQLTEAYAWEQTPRYLIRDRDGAYGDVLIRRLRAMGIRDRPIAPRSPWQNGHTERLIGSIRRDCLDHVVVFGEQHLRHLLGSYQRYYNETRTHLSLNKDAPASRAVQAVGRIVANAHLGGLHHQYVRI